MHPEAYEYVRHASYHLYPRPVRVVEIGSRNINGSVRGLFSDALQYRGLDLYEGPDVDIVANGATWQPARDERPDAVVCCEVLEHATTAADIVRNAVKMLRPGGTAIFTCAGAGRTPHSAIDGGPIREGEHYENVTREMVEEWIEPIQSLVKHILFGTRDDRADLYFHIFTNGLWEPDNLRG